MPSVRIVMPRGGHVMSGMVTSGVGAHGHHAVFDMPRDEPPIHWVGADEPGYERHGHDEPECRAARVGGLVDCGHPEFRDDQHAGHQYIHREELWNERHLERLHVVAACHITHSKCLEEQPAETEAKRILEADVDSSRHGDVERNRSAEDDAKPVAGSAVHGGPEYLLPRR